MLSGDHLETAKAVAIKSGIVTAEEADQDMVCMDAATFRSRVGGTQKGKDEKGNEIDEVVEFTEFRQIADKLKVLARSTPEDKHTVVVGLKAMGKSVAVTGDGINDVHALRAANVGFAMGSGCEIAKDASDMILMNDNFGATMVAVKFGRNIYDNIRKFLQFQMTMNLAVLAIIFVVALIFGDSPFCVIQLLYINLLMDAFAALALATEPPHAT